MRVAKQSCEYLCSRVMKRKKDFFIYQKKYNMKENNLTIVELLNINANKYKYCEERLTRDKGINKKNIRN